MNEEQLALDIYRRTYWKEPILVEDEDLADFHEILDAVHQAIKAQSK